MRILQEKGKKAFCYQKLFSPFTVWMNCHSDLKNFANSWPSSFSRSLEQFFLKVGQNNFGKKIPNQAEKIKFRIGEAKRLVTDYLTWKKCSKTNLSAQIDCLLMYLNKKVIFKVKEGKLLEGNMILSMDIFLYFPIPKKELV